MTRWLREYWLFILILLGVLFFVAIPLIIYGTTDVGWSKRLSEATIGDAVRLILFYAVLSNIFGSRK